MSVETAIIHKGLAGIIQYCIQEPASSELGQLLHEVSPATFMRDKLALPTCLQNAFSGIYHSHKIDSLDQPLFSVKKPLPMYLNTHEKPWRTIRFWQPRIPMKREK